MGRFLWSEIQIAWVLRPKFKNSWMSFVFNVYEGLACGGLHKVVQSLSISHGGIILGVLHCLREAGASVCRKAMRLGLPRLWSPDARPY
jgi:hypothetical protein